jgi:adenylate kinase family enzyme
MQNCRMQRILVMGPPGSGKSTLARHLGARHGLPVFHLDQAFWQSGWVQTPAEVFQDSVDRIAALPQWVIDGNYIDTLAPRLRAADTIVYLDVPTWLSLLRIARRVVTSYGRVRPDSAPGCAEKLDLEFLLYTAQWNRIRRARHLALVDSFDGRKIVLRATREAERLVEAIRA